MSDAMDQRVKELVARFDALRNSGICSPTTRALLDEAQALLIPDSAGLQT